MGSICFGVGAGQRFWKSNRRSGVDGELAVRALYKNKVVGVAFIYIACVRRLRNGLAGFSLRRADLEDMQVCLRVRVVYPGVIDGHILNLRDIGSSGVHDEVEF